MKKIMVLILFIVVSTILKAQNTQIGGPSIGLSPMLVERNVSPGDTFKFELYVDNNNEFETFDFKAFVADVKEKEDGTYKVLKPGTTPYSIAKYVKIDPTEFSVPPKGTKIINVTVSIPRGLVGGLYGVIVVELQPPKSTEEEGALQETAFVYQMTSFLEVTLKGTRQRLEAFCDSFEVKLSKDTPYKAYVGDDALVFIAKVANTGNVHVVTHGTLMIQTPDKRTVARMPLGGGRGVIIPDSAVNLISITRRKFPPGKYIARAIIDYGGRRPAIAETTFVIKEKEVEVQETKKIELAKFLVDPQEIEFELMPRSFRSKIIKVINRGDTTVELEAKVLPLEFDVYGDLLPEGERKGSIDWVKVTPSVFKLGPGKSRNVRISVRVPKDANGGYYGDIIFRSKGVESSETGANLLIFVGKEVVKKASLKIKNVKISKDAVSFDIMFMNEGNIHLKPDIQVALVRHYPQVEENGIVKAPRDEIIANANKSGADNNPVLPKTERIYGILFPIVLEEGNYEVLVRADFGGAEPLIARQSFKVGGNEK